MQPHEDEAEVAPRHDSPDDEARDDRCDVERSEPRVERRGRARTQGREDPRMDGPDDAMEAETGRAALHETAHTEQSTWARPQRLDRRESRDRNRPQGRVEALRAAVLVFARARLAPLSTEDAAAIAALDDENELTELVDTLAQAESVGDARVVLDAALAGTRE